MKSLIIATILLTSFTTLANDKIITGSSSYTQRCRPFNNLEIRGVAFNAIEDAFKQCQSQFKKCNLLSYQVTDFNEGTSFDDCRPYPATTSPGRDIARVTYEAKIEASN